MARRSITDEEIALIKAMLARHMAGRDIQFFFNRPDRPVNSGRISDIASGKYGDSSSISPAPDADLDAFLATRSPSVAVPAVVLAAADRDTGPMAEPTLRQMFSENARGVWCLTSGETDQVECKTSFGLRHPSAWLRAVAALANNRGGYVLFGVGDAASTDPHTVLGLSSDEFATIDTSEIAKRLRATFDPTPSFRRAVVSIAGKRVGVLHVELHPSRPIIATRAEGGNDIREGDIFFRYSGQSRRISYADLRAMLDQRDAQARADIMPMIGRLLSLGPDRAMIADLSAGQLMDGKQVIQLDESIIQRLSFIKEGEFDERTGAPALRLVGDVQPTTTLVTKKGLVTREEMRRDFLADKLTADATDYLRCAVEVSGSDWLPIRYFAKAAGLSHPQLIAFIDGNPSAPGKQKQLCRERLSSSDRAHVAAPGRAVQGKLKRLLAGERLEPKDVTEARDVALAVQALPRPISLDGGKLRALLSNCDALIQKGNDPNAKTALRKAIARLDELLCPLQDAP
ncbi:ATP-binding protein [Neoroseomonas lacus]|uniref:Schlafen AlbA-2 domain-containing protein n=1 Tax=Neoroseomonas lacus TaxID=287609 RepID=A0A917KPG1_9PROT|nr:ATP-binding protein [Neoroseomonas lacus]GGJ21791.1 hypothetical protein GCM10011320_31290 [Neoroseomonas lacus]